MNTLTLRRSAAVLAVAAIPATIAAAPVVADASGAHAAATARVTLKHIMFTPRTVRVSRGGSVTWVWKDGSVPHNVTGAFGHSRTQKSGTFTVRFAKKGTFRYACTIHPGMTGTVVVK